MTFIKNTAQSWYNVGSRSFVESLLSTTVDFVFEYDAALVGPAPELIIGFNNQTVYSNRLCNESRMLSLQLVPGPGPQKITICMRGKTQSNTIVEDTKILHDTFVVIKNFQINNYRLLDDYQFYENKFCYTIGNDNSMVKPLRGFWQDACVSLEFDTPFDLWYNSGSTANKQLAEPMRLKTSDNLEQIVHNLEQSLKKLI